MRIILNSDMLHMNRLLDTGLARHIDEFCRESAQFGGILVLPRTVILENERQQQSLYEEAVAKLEAARQTLAQCGIAVPAFRPEDVLRKVDLPTALRDTGITVEIENPTIRSGCIERRPLATPWNNSVASAGRVL